MKFFLMTLSILMIATHAQAGGLNSQTKGSNIPQMKRFMEEFGSEVITMQILKSEKMDWTAVDKSITKMEVTLSDLRKADKAGNYKAFLDLLEIHIKDMRAKTSEKKKSVFKSFDELQNACFQCHVINRPVKMDNDPSLDYSGTKK